MKVALCLYGTIGGAGGKSGDSNDSQLDVFRHAFPHYQKFILEKNNVDVFIHSWDLGIEKDVVSNYKPKISEFEKQIVFDIPEHIEKSQRVQNHFSRWYSCKKVISFKRKFEEENKFKYDFVMLTRQDLAWQKDIIFSDYNNEYFYVADWYQHHTGEPMGYPKGNYNKSLQDVWFFSNSDYMDEVSNIYDNIPYFHKENSSLSGYKGISNHRLLYHKLTKMNIIPDKLRFSFRFDRLGYSDSPLVRWLYFGDNT